MSRAGADGRESGRHSARRRAAPPALATAPRPTACAEPPQTGATTTRAIQTTEDGATHSRITFANQPPPQRRKRQPNCSYRALPPGSARRESPPPPECRPHSPRRRPATMAKPSPKLAHRRHGRLPSVAGATATQAEACGDDGRANAPPPPHGPPSPSHRFAIGPRPSARVARRPPPLAGPTIAAISHNRATHFSAATYTHAAAHRAPCRHTPHRQSATTDTQSPFSRHVTLAYAR